MAVYHIFTRSPVHSHGWLGVVHRSRWQRLRTGVVRPTYLARIRPVAVVRGHLLARIAGDLLLGRHHRLWWCGRGWGFRHRHGRVNWRTADHPPPTARRRGLLVLAPSAEESAERSTATPPSASSLNGLKYGRCDKQQAKCQVPGSHLDRDDS